ncbi:MAG: bifunctional 5,10-methylene-tetrahydrofolate dehydrogenase/5,10-methylene-tetrahydrofolate cyclohydrolase, partial [Verrucomicrobiota bacterium]
MPLLGKHVVIVGRSNIVGKPLAALLMQKAPHCNATVTLVHSFSENLEEICRQADILIAAIGKPAFINKTMVKPQAAVIDVGINYIINNQGEK